MRGICYLQCPVLVTQALVLILIYLDAVPQLADFLIFGLADVFDRSLQAFHSDGLFPHLQTKTIVFSL